MALRMICDREAEIEAFIPEEYWNLEADFSQKGSKKTLNAKFYGTRDEKIAIHKKDELDQILAELEGKGLCGGRCKVRRAQQEAADPVHH